MTEEEIQQLAYLGYEEEELRELDRKLRTGVPLDEFESILWTSVRTELGAFPLWFELEGK